jgi:hypothetical protein
LVFRHRLEDGSSDRATCPLENSSFVVSVECKARRRSTVMHTRGKIAVTGATGRVGRHVVDLLEERGHGVVGISRSLGVDVVTGEGLVEALVGVETVIDTATGASPEQQPATEFFTASARNLQQIGEQAGVERIVVVSIIATLAGPTFEEWLRSEPARSIGPIARSPPACGWQSSRRSWRPSRVVPSRRVRSSYRREPRSRGGLQ